MRGFDSPSHELIDPAPIKTGLGYPPGPSKKAHYAHGWERSATAGCGYPGNRRVEQGGQKRTVFPAVDDPVGL